MMKVNFGALMSALLAGALAACGGTESTARCGNGEVEAPEACDDGNASNDDNCSTSCSVLASTRLTITWPINQGRFQDSSLTDGCPDVGATHAVVVLKGGTPPAGGAAIDRRTEFSCDLGSNIFLNTPAAPLYAGAYEARVKLIKRVVANDAGVVGGDTDLTREKVLNFQVADRSTSTQVANFQIDDFLMSYMGGLQFTSVFGSSNTCAMATPPVLKQVLLLRKRGGAVIAKMTFDNPGTTTVNESVLTDGMAKGVCVDASAGVSQQIFGLDWGDYDLGIKGLGAGDVPTFCQTFPVFVGAQMGATFNPSYRLVVPPIGAMLPDAGLDGGVPDGGMSITCF